MNKVFFHLLLLFFCLVTSPDAISCRNIKLTPGKKEIVVTNAYLDFWENNASVKVNVRHLNRLNNKFVPLDMKIPNFGFSTKDIWFRFIVQNPSDRQQFRSLMLSNPNLDVADLYVLTKNNDTKLVAQRGDLLMSVRKNSNRQLIFPFEIEPGATRTFFLKVNNGGEQFHFTPTILTKDKLYSKEYHQQYFFGIFFGILLFVLLFNLMVGILIREKSALYYCFYIAAFILLQASLLGYGKEFLWSKSSFWTNHANPIFASLAIFFLLKFCMLYLEMKTLMPRVHKLSYYLLCVIVVAAVLSAIPLSFFYEKAIILVNVLTLLLNVLIIPVAIHAIRQEYKPAKIFFIAFFLLIISVFAFVLKNFGVLPSNNWTDNGLQFGSAAEVILLSFGIVSRFKLMRDQSLVQLQEINVLKEETNIQLEKKVKQRTSEIESQKNVIEDKNKEIMSSIMYAKRIQEAILPTELLMDSLLPEWALFYSPKDTISGDFYWVNARTFESKQWVFFAVADCTGHGIPGAMMSVLCNNALDNSLLEISEPNPGLLLEETNSIVTKNLSTDISGVNDGMDISLCCYDASTGQLHWAGANNGLFILRSGKLEEIIPTKRPIGKSSSTDPFIHHTKQVEKGDRIILFSDGIIDQFGGANNKKFKKNQLKEVIEQSHSESVKQQIESIRTSFLNWKSKEEQVDDVCLLIVEIV